MAQGEGAAPYSLAKQSIPINRKRQIMTIGSAARARIVAEVLAERGWELAHGAAIGRKVFKTAVGDKDAHAYLSIGDIYAVSLNGEYWSEGKNVLGIASELVPLTATAEEVCGITERFAASVDYWVALTYAVRALKTQEA
jgi:hypothetical protein